MPTPTYQPPDEVPVSPVSGTIDHPDMTASACDCRDCQRARAGYEDTFEEEDEEPEYSSEDSQRETEEAPLSSADRNALPAPLLRFLRNGGRRWSAEVEINQLGYGQAARLLSAEIAGYRGDEGSARNGSVFSTPDCTVDAEIKLSRMRDGNERHAQTCRKTYDRLRDAGASVGYNCGHHVHVDAQRIAEMGMDRAFEVVQAAVIVAKACDATLMALAASGFEAHRDTAGNEYGACGWCTSEDVLHGRYSLHASRTSYAINYEEPSAATIEYRLPNGTLEPIRAHAHIAVPLGLVDLAERAVLDSDEEAKAAVASAKDVYEFTESAGAVFLVSALRLHSDSYAALAVAADTAPCGAATRKAFAAAAKRYRKAA